MFVGRNLPQLLDTQSINLGSRFVPQAEQAGQFLGQATARTFREEGVFGVQLHAWLEVGPMRTVAGNAHVARGDALHRTVFVEEDLRGRESREDLDAELFCLPGKPTAEIAEAQGVRALIPHEGRQGKVRHRPFAVFRENPVMVLGDWHGEWRVLVLPVRDQLVERLRVDDRARQDMCANLAALFENADPDFAPSFGGQLLQTDRRGQPRRTGTDDHHVIGHGFAFAHRLPSSRSRGGSPATALLFLDRVVNASGESATWVGSTTA